MLGRERGGEEGERKGKGRREEGQSFAIQCRIDLLAEHCAVCASVGVGVWVCELIWPKHYSRLTSLVH